MSKLTENSPIDALRRKEGFTDPRHMPEEVSLRPAAVTSGDHDVDHPGLVRKGDFYLLDWDGPDDPGNPRK
jgi:hypothetical protein